jgi:hypothetical protein
MRTNPIIPHGWSLRKVKFHYDVVYWGSWALHILSSMMPGVNTGLPAADVSYTLQRNADGKIETVRLDGEHAADALAKTIQFLETESPST